VLAGLCGEWTRSTSGVGRGVAWLDAGLRRDLFAVVVLRYAFDIGFPWLQELYVWQHAAVFMAGAGYTMLHRGHVNVDVIYGRIGPAARPGSTSWARALFLFPLARRGRVDLGTVRAVLLERREASSTRRRHARGSISSSPCCGPSARCCSCRASHSLSGAPVPRGPRAARPRRGPGDR